MKLHRNLALAVVSALESVFENQQVASRALDNLFAQNPKWGKRDRAFVAETTYEIVRWRRFLAFAVQKDDHWSLLAARLLQNHEELPEWPEISGLNAASIRARLQTRDLPRAIRESIPDWLDDFAKTQLGANWDAEIAALNREAPVVLRANTLKISRDELQKQLQNDEIETQTITGLPNALQLQTRRSVSHLPHFKNGGFEFQDAASQLVAPFLRAQSGHKILDACAGAGGKSLHLAALIKNRGHIVSCDTESEKLAELRRRASRNGISCLETKTPKTLESHGQKFDRILIDAPCSGLGTLRRQPDLKWRLTPEFLAQIEGKQREILDFYAPMLQTGGFLVYATCSILPSENERQIEAFLSRNSGWQLDEKKPVSPAETGFDGFFMARLRRL
ncbi:MAG TPA: class I SAM-dependent methyltransferase [Abditibacterium sp.]